MIEALRTQSLETPAFRGPLAFCSNMFPAKVFGFSTLEHAYVACKTQDPHLRERIRAAPTPEIAKCMGNPKHRLCVIPEVRPGWDQMKLVVMRTLVREKFFRHAALAALLLATEEIPLVERNRWHDTFWGVCDGRGKNHLGRILIEVRGELKR